MPLQYKKDSAASRPLIRIQANGTDISAACRLIMNIRTTLVRFPVSGEPLLISAPKNRFLLIATDAAMIGGGPQETTMGTRGEALPEGGALIITYKCVWSVLISTYKCAVKCTYKCT